MLSAWRIVKAKHAKSAFNGEGARLFGGRWNSVGKTVVYVSEHQSMAALELLVHVRPLIPKQRYLAYLLEWNESLMEKVEIAKLPKNWKKSPAPVTLQAIGDHWLEKGATPVLAVPSAVLPVERNFLLNPLHPDFSKIRIHHPIPFIFDPRLKGR